MNTQKLVIIILAFFAMLCTFLPWVEEYGMIYYGRQMDGWITLVLFGTTLSICLGENLKEPLEKKYKVGIYGSSGLATIIGISKIIYVSPLFQIFNLILPDSMHIPLLSSRSIKAGLDLMILTGILILASTAFFPNGRNERDNFNKNE